MASVEAGITSVFSDFQKYLTADQELREQIRVCVRDIEQKSREIHTQLQQVHQIQNIKNTPALCARMKPEFTTIAEDMKKLAAIIPPNQYYRFHDHWKTVMQKLSFLTAFIKYLEKEELNTREEAAKMVGVYTNREEGFHMDLDDYLHGLLQLASELSRLAVNSVTAGDYGRPLRIAKFIAELDAGFRLLNLKNDSLRKRFDVLKYDLKKVEEVVYDLTIRGLKPAEQMEQESK
ncbi:translin-like [Mytilus trossulus]|uniref:translin-like n=1 Tax=Mytilus trossulus TaxID=6551 RepID=UPI0030044F73